MFSNIWNHPKTTIVGLLAAAGTVFGVLSTQGVSLGHVGAGTGVALGSALVTALLGMLARDPSSGTGTAATALLLALFLTPALRAQTTTPTPGALFTPSGGAMGFELGGNYAVGTDVAETLNITKSCGIEGRELLVPTFNLQSYLGGISCTPDFSALLAKTVLPSNTINFSFHGDGGVVRNTGPSTPLTNAAAYLGGCVSYNPGGGAVVVPTCVNYAYLPGFFKSSNGISFTAGIAYVFGH